jgi:hypothetical protein
MGSSLTGEAAGAGEFGLLEADIEEAVSILHLHTAKAMAAQKSQAAARAELVSRLELALQVMTAQVPATPAGQ